MPERNQKAVGRRKSGIIFRAWRINPKTGEKEWAKTYGFRAWPIPIDEHGKEVDRFE
jgi:hypothetical protein